MDLNERQERFCQLYVETGNATQSYIDAGYTPEERRSAESSAHKLLRKAEIQMRVSQIRVKLNKHFQTSQEMIVDKLCRIVFEGSTIAEIDENGELKLIPYADVNDVDGLSFSKSEMSSRNESAKGSISETSSSSTSFSIKNRDKIKALDMLCKILGIYDVNKKQSDSGTFDANSRRALDAIRKLRTKNVSSEDSRE